MLNSVSLDQICVYTGVVLSLLWGLTVRNQTSDVGVFGQGCSSSAMLRYPAELNGNMKKYETHVWHSCLHSSVIQRHVEESRTPGLIVFEDSFSSHVNPPGQTQGGRPFEDVNVHMLRAESAKPSMEQRH